MNSPILAILVVIVIVIGSALTLMDKSCKNGYHAWCAPMSTLVRHHTKNRLACLTEVQLRGGRVVRKRGPL
jgi:hypothetical protein